MKRFKNILFALAILLLFAPLAQRYLELLEPRKLYGYFETPEPETFDSKNWLNGSYQQYTSEDFEQKMGFRPLMLQLFNQYLYSFYHKSKTFVVPAKDDQFFAYNYYMSVYGDNFIGEDSLRYNYNQLVRLQQSVQENHGIPVLIVIAPNKVMLLKEYLPDRFKMEGSPNANYPLWQQISQQNQIPVLDFNQILPAVDNGSVNQFYANTSTHWNSLGMYLAQQKITEKLDELGVENTPNISWNELVLKDSVIASDRELAENLNLLFPPKTSAQLFPELQIESNNKLKGLIIGDSYFWNFFNLGGNFTDVWSKESKFWYYNNTQLGIPDGSRTAVTELNAKEALEQADFVLIMGTEANLHLMPYGFPEKYFNEIEAP